MKTYLILFSLLIITNTLAEDSSVKFTSMRTIENSIVLKQKDTINDSLDIKSFPQALAYTATLSDDVKLKIKKNHKVEISYFKKNSNDVLFKETHNNISIIKNQVALKLGKGKTQKIKHDSLQELFANNLEVEMSWVVDGITLYPKIGILPAGHSQKSGMLLKGEKTNEEDLHWKGFNRPSSVSSFSATLLTSDRTAEVNASTKRNPYEINMNGPYLSIPVRDMPLAIQSPQAFQEKEITTLRHEDLYDKNGLRYGTKSPKQLDALAEISRQNPRGFLTPTASLDFAGMPNISGFYPPDIEGAVGVDYYVQMVNSTFAIYNKSDGTVAQAALNTKTLWASHGGRCQSDNDGDAIALYDEQAGRWVLTQFAVTASPESVCFAISVTGDPTGAYYTYDLAAARFPDYYKLGVWPVASNNAYFMGTNSGGQNQYDVYAIDRENMLLGLPARPAQFFQSFRNLLMPADVDGDTPPPANAPGLLYTFRDAGEPYFGNPANDSIDVYEFNVDWNTPANTTFTLAQVITSANGLSNFNWTVCGFFVSDCLPQGGTSVNIDSGSWWPQQRLQYRNFGGFETLVGTWTVDVLAVGNHAAPRWFELRRNIGAGSWGLRQQGTFAPDSDHRFSPSISMDASENIGLGYSVTSSSSFPSIRFTVHDASVDPLGTMEPEQIMVAGGGSQTGTANRWGDYASMDVDPVDDCTFWFTSEYYTSTSAAGWATRIGSFKVPTCKNYSITAADNSIEVCKADDATSFSLSLSSSYDAITNMSFSGCPVGASCAFSPNPVISPTSTSVLNLSNLTGAVGGSHLITATATDSVDPLATSDIDLSLYLFNGNPGTPALSSPTDGSFVVSLGPNLSWSAVTDGQDYLVEVDNDPAFGSVNFSTTVVGGLTTSASSGLNENTCYYWRVSPSNLCGNGTTSNVFNFYTGAAQSTADFASTNVPLTIATVPVSVPSTLSITGVGVINDVNVVSIDITHSYVGDLTLALESPLGTVVTIMNVGCGTSNNLNLSLDDEAAGTWTCTGSPIGGGGTFQPSNALSAFDGEDANGVWTLTVIDGFNGDGGSINGWGLNFENFANNGDQCPSGFTVGGNVSGLLGSGLVLQNNLGDNLPIASDGSFTFLTALANFDPYSVTVLTQPNSPSQTCSVTSGSGNIASGNVSNVSVICTSLPDVSFNGNNLTQNVCVNPGPTAITPVTLTTTALNGYNNNVNLAFNPVLPMGITGGFSNNNFVPAAAPGTNSTLNLNVDNTASAGLNSITIEASGASITTKSVDLNLNVVFGLSSSPTISSPVDGSLGVATNTSFTWNAISGATSYEIDIATDPAFSSIVHSANIATNSYTPGAALTNATVYYWRVRAANSCNTTDYTVSAFETVGGSGITTTSFCSAPNLNVSIPDNNSSGVDNILNIATIGLITDVNISADISHTWVGDIAVEITSPDSTPIVVIDRPGYTGSGNGCSRNNIDTVLDNSAGTSVESVCLNADPTIDAGPYIPNNPLSGFNNKNLNGNWIINVSDNAGTDTGTLNQWCVIATIDSGSSLAPADYSDLNSSYGIAKHSGDGTSRLGDNWTVDTAFVEDGDSGDDDGITASGDWLVGSSNAIITATVNTTGFLYCWFDWNNDGAFAGSELGVSSSLPLVSPSSNIISVTVPATTFGDGNDESLETRCRFYDSAQTFAPATPTGSTNSGEVEDYKLPADQLTPVTLAYNKSTRNNSGLVLDWTTTTESGTIGFNIYGLENNLWRQLNSQPISAKGINSVSPHDYHFNTGITQIEAYKIEELTVNGKKQTYGPYTTNVTYGKYPNNRAINWQSITQESNLREINRQEGLKQGFDFVKISVNETGIQRITYEDLVSIGVDWQGVVAEDISLSFENKAIARVVSDGVFGQESYIDFIGSSANSLYTKTNVYVLKLDASLSRKEIKVTNTEFNIDASAYHMATTKLNDDLVYSFASPTDSPWFLKSLLVYTNSNDWSFPISVPHLLDNNVTSKLEVKAWGGTDWPQVTDHHMQVLLDNQLIGDIYSDGLKSINLSENLNHAQVAGISTITFKLPADTGVDYDLVQLDSFSLEFPAEIHASNNKLSFFPVINSSANADVIFTNGFENNLANEGFLIKGLSTQNTTIYAVNGINLYDFPLKKTNSVAGGFELEIPLLSNNGVKYYINSTDNLIHPNLSLAKNSVINLSQQYDYLMISHPDFTDTLNQLVNYHQAKGLKVLVANVEDIYAQYSFHRIEAASIKSFIKEAASLTGIQTVLLVGSDTSDYLNNLNIGSKSFIPTLYFPTDDIVKYAPVDSLFADINDDLIPDLSIGRLPVRTNLELQNIFDKILLYVNRSYGDTAVFSSDRSSSFDSFSNQMVNLLPPNWQVKKAYINTLDISAAQTTLVNSIENGVSLTSFFGHSGPNTWSFEHLFDNNDVLALNNLNKPTIVNQFGCWNTYYVMPGFDTMAHHLMSLQNKGAVAVMGASSLTQSNHESMLGNLLIPKMSQSNVPTGQAILYAKQVLAHSHPDYLDVILGWTLLGDPMTVLNQQ